MKRGLVSALAALLIGGGGVMAQAPQPVAVFPNRPDSTPIRQVQATPQDLQGYGPAPGGVQGPMAPDGGLMGAATGEPVLPASATQRIEPDWRVWADADYLLWRTNKPALPSTASVVPAGVLMGTASTTFATTINGLPVGPSTQSQQVFIPVGAQSGGVAGGDLSALGEQNGYRVTVGAWILPDELCGVEGSFLKLERRAVEFGTVFTNNNNATNQFVLTAGNFPVVILTGAAGGTTVSVSSGTAPILLLASSSGALSTSYTTILDGAELNARTIMFWIGGFKMGALAGVRYLNFREDFVLNDNYTLNISNASAAAAGMGATFSATGFTNTFLANTIDAITTRNQFYGPQVGLYAELRCGDFFLNGDVKTAVGPNLQTVGITSFTTFPFVVGGGSIFGPTDNGEHHRTRFSVAAEGNLQVGYQCFSWLRCFAGFDFLYFLNTARPANQTAPGSSIFVSVAGTNNQAAVAPQQFHFGDQNAWFEGLSLGLEFRY